MKTLTSIFVALLMSAIAASALTLDWSTVTWTAGSTTGTFDLDADGKNDITITFSGATGSLISGYPANGTLFDGGGAGDNSLGVYLNFADSSSTIVVTVSFLNMIGADNLTISLLDIDADRNGSSSNYKFRDQLTGIYGINNGTNIAPNISVSSTSVNTVSGSGTNQTVTASALVNDTGGSSGNGGVSISFTQTVQSATISFGNGTGVVSGGDPEQQTFALFDISFTPKKLPETGTTLISLGICATALLGRQLLRFRRKGTTR